MNMMRQFGKNTLILGGLTVLCVLFLSGGNTIYERVQAERQRDLRMSILRTFGEHFSEATFDGAFARTVTVEERPRDKATVFRYRGRPAQAAVLIAGPGLWGVITMLVFFNTDSKTITGIRVLSHSETPGLGSRIEENWFTDQFRKLDATQAVRIVTRRTGAPNEVDAITGATKSSTSVEAIVNRAEAIAGGGR